MLCQEPRAIKGFGDKYQWFCQVEQKSYNVCLISFTLPHQFYPASSVLPCLISFTRGKGALHHFLFGSEHGFTDFF
jgi:hypothetical protein